ncbi:MAG: hypothetical protein AB1780_12500 [Pseudomonadota bacterium]|uniref:hypothetical protein n=1 Tax=Rheinheimera fenheensis TaxID=3152295 RepID=UPI0032612C63
MSNIVLWQPESGELIPASARTPSEISNYAAQLSIRDKQQIVAAFESGHFEMGMNYLWGKTATALKKELSAVGVGLLGEMLGKADVDEDDDVEDIITTKEAIILAEELGIVSSTDAMRLKHTYEIITHFSRLEIEESDFEQIDESEALSSLKACIKAVLGRPKVEVAKKFVEFREALEGESLSENDPRVDMLRSSPYFFNKLTVSVLMNAAKKNTGANLEHALANINVLIPAIWSKLRDSEKWQVGHAYAEAFADGKTTSVGGLKSALLKVKGFDYVPENLRSDTFTKAAEAIFKAHDGLNNFYNEPAPVKNLAKLGTTIPTPALPVCFSALLCVTLGNSYGVSWAAETEAKSLLKSLSSDRWVYYLNNVLPSDTRILNKLTSSKPLMLWMNLVSEFKLDALEIKNNTVSRLIKASSEKSQSRIQAAREKLLEEFYGKKS